MAHEKNIKDFVDAASTCASPLLKAYCGLVAIELVLKKAIGLSNHDVPSGLTRLNNDQPKSGGHSLISLADQLRGNIDMIQVTGKDGTQRAAPRDSYPFIRYTTFDVDGWESPCTSENNVKALAATVARIRNYLKAHYGYKL